MNEQKHRTLWMVEDRPTSDGQATRSYWTKIGDAFENRDGSWSLEFAAIPVSGKALMCGPMSPEEQVKKNREAFERDLAARKDPA